jgi:hypothetical protein
MSPESENFESLRRLLALKRHEQPPPGYFDKFSSRVLARIEAGEAGAGYATAGAGWWQRLRMAFEAKPIFAGAFGAGICAVLISGILNSEQTGTLPAVLTPLAAQAAPTSYGDGTLSVAQNNLDYPMMAGGSNSIASLFDHFQTPTQPASAGFVLPGGN